MHNSDCSVKASEHPLDAAATASESNKVPLSEAFEIPLPFPKIPHPGFWLDSWERALQFERVIVERVLSLLFITVVSFMYLVSPSGVKRSPFLGKDCTSKSCASGAPTYVGISAGSLALMVL